MEPETTSLELILYERVGCHLCEEMRAALRPWCARFGLRLRVVDIGQDAELLQRHGPKVPVLAIGDREICHHFLDEQALRAAIAPRGPAGAHD